MDEYKADKKKKYSAPTDYLRSELIRSLYTANAMVARYTSRQKIGLMHQIMEVLAAPYNYFITYAGENGLKFSESEKKLIRKVNTYYIYRKVYILPPEAQRLLRLLIQLAYKSGLYNVHRLQSEGDEGI